MARLGQSDLEFDSPGLQLCQGSWAHKSTRGCGHINPHRAMCWSQGEQRRKVNFTARNNKAHLAEPFVSCGIPGQQREGDKQFR